MSSELPDLVSLNCVARRCGVSRHTVHRWRVDRGLPEPDLVVDGKPLWRWDTIAAWLADTGRAVPEAWES